jgi:hypothetical protein
MAALGVIKHRTLEASLQNISAVLKYVAIGSYLQQWLAMFPYFFHAWKQSSRIFFNKANPGIELLHMKVLYIR